jgi:hypothetical protein
MIPLIALVILVQVMKCLLKLHQVAFNQKIKKILVKVGTIRCKAKCGGIITTSSLIALENSECKKAVENLEEENTKLQKENGELREEISYLKEELFSSKVKLLKATEANEAYEKILPNINKESRRPEMLVMIGATIVAILNVIMRKNSAINMLACYL